MSTKKIVITGGPGTGKTSLIDSLEELGYTCLPEISRQVTLQARNEGVEQLFLTDPLLFSKKLLEGRKDQFFESQTFDRDIIFIDRGLPDVLAYMDFIGDEYPQYFIDICEEHKYDQVFILPPWEAIYTSDSERYENFEQAVRIHDYLEASYRKYGYDLISVPLASIKDRVEFILSHSK
ncbi:AAA family ATPase [Leptobacterium flavescens]|uniref:AAA family ATPase n=1 Tax=Leptobacterium flavescens TaxID=472055 RepID=A0A6P0UF74_9FLAO|nr:ATP-binding protein [Leptobacterium flavescens]NER11924.1 AAA family ATPase [Leptobacterium flavescens]